MGVCIGTGAKKPDTRTLHGRDYGKLLEGIKEQRPWEREKMYPRAVVQKKELRKKPLLGGGTARGRPKRARKGLNGHGITETKGTRGRQKETRLGWRPRANLQTEAWEHTKEEATVRPLGEQRSQLHIGRAQGRWGKCRNGGDRNGPPTLGVPFKVGGGPTGGEEGSEARGKKGDSVRWKKSICRRERI